MSMISVLLLNVLTVALTWLVVFRWDVGFEYNSNSFWQLSTYGPFVTLAVTQFTLAGVFIFVKSGFGYISRIKLKHLAGKEDLHIEEKISHVTSQYSRLTKIVLSIILTVIAADAVNDVSNVLVLFHVL